MKLSSRATSRATSRASVLALAAASLAASTAAQAGYDWDHADGLGVRYLLYKRMEPARIKAKDYPPELRKMFLPKSKGDWVRFKGTALAWGVNVYEFPAVGDAKGFAGFLSERDPRRAFRDFKVEKQAENASESYWEFVDTWRPFVEVLDRPKPRGPYRYAVSPELGVRFMVDKTMQHFDPLATPDGANCFARIMPETRLWIQIPGLMGPAGWTVRVFVFPPLERKMARTDMKNPVKSFREFIEGTDHYRKTHDRKYLIRAEPAAAAAGKNYELWRWMDTRNDNRTKVIPFYHYVAAAYKVGERDVVLVGQVPSKDPEPDKDIYGRVERMVKSLEPWSGEAKAPGFSYYSVASSCKTDGKEVAVVVYVPMGPNPKPDRKLLESARRMARSLQPASSGKIP
jgi:hypothetical protein